MSFALIKSVHDHGSYHHIVVFWSDHPRYCFDYKENMDKASHGAEKYTVVNVSECHNWEIDGADFWRVTTREDDGKRVVVIEPPCRSFEIDEVKLVL